MQFSRFFTVGFVWASCGLRVGFEWVSCGLRGGGGAAGGAGGGGAGRGGCGAGSGGGSGRGGDDGGDCLNSDDAEQGHAQEKLQVGSSSCIISSLYSQIQAWPLQT